MSDSVVNAIAIVAGLVGAAVVAAYFLGFWK
jgi:hypothetical protein